MSFVMTGAVNEGDWWDDRDTGPFRVTGDPDDDVFYDKAWRGMYAASVLWELLGSDKGERLTQLVQGEIKQDKNRDEDGTYIVTPAQVARLAELMAGLETAVSSVLASRDPTDNEWVVHPEQQDRVCQSAPADVVQKLRKNNKTVYVLTDALYEAVRVGTFLGNMAALNRPLNYG